MDRVGDSLAGFWHHFARSPVQLPIKFFYL